MLGIDGQTHRDPLNAWGLIEMVAGRAGSATGFRVVDHARHLPGPHAYLTKGRNYPPEVIAVVVAMIVAAPGSRPLRWWREQLIVRGPGPDLRRPRPRALRRLRSPLWTTIAGLRRRGARLRSYGQDYRRQRIALPRCASTSGCIAHGEELWRWWRSIRPPRQC